jgi:Flp pilus assembly protein TadD
MATAVDRDPRGDAERALGHYRRSLELEPDQPRCLGEYGLLALRLGQTDAGLASLRRAAELAPDDPDTTDKLATGLRLAGRADEARAVLRAARFRHPRDPRFLKLWNDHQFQELRKEQEAARRTAASEQDDGPVLLPFVRPPEGTRPLRLGRKTIRKDVATPLPPPRLPRPSRLPGRRHAL